MVDENEQQHNEAEQFAIAEEALTQPAPVVDTNDPAFYERPIPLLRFASTNAWRLDKDGNRVAAMELMGGFVYKMGLAGRLADRESAYRAAFEEFCRS